MASIREMKSLRISQIVARLANRVEDVIEERRAREGTPLGDPPKANAQKGLVTPDRH